MGTTIKPVMYKTQEAAGYLNHLANDIESSLGADADLLLSHPAIYIHVWRNKYDILNDTWSIYIGETNDIIERTKAHWAAAKIPKEKRKAGNWQHHMIEDVDENGKQVIPVVYFFGHKLFHKSLTLDIENKLIDYCFSMETAHTHNGRGNNQDYNGKFKEPQLDEIMKRARVTVIMFDENQILHKGQIFTMNYMVQKRNLAKSQGPNPSAGESNYIQMINQLRMNCAKRTMDWVDSFSKDLVLQDLLLDSKWSDSVGYEVKTFDTPMELHDAIKAKASKDETQLSRIIATYDWKYVNGSYAPMPQKYWQVDINGWALPWNEQLYHLDIKPTLNNRKKHRYDELDWAEKDYSINEAGSTFTIQGFDLAFSGVILGPSVRYDKASGRIWFDESLRAWNNMTGNRTLRDGTVVNVANTISQHELRVLMTRGTKGVYIYACDKDLRDELKKRIKHKC